MTPFYIITIAIATLIYVDGQSCGGENECISILNCTSKLALLNKKEKTVGDFDLLKKSFCGFDDKYPKVCCPLVRLNNCTTPEGKAGECINIHSCPHLADKLRPPVVDDNLLYVKKARCQSADQYSVCCGPPPTVPAIGDCEATVSAFPPDSRTECCGYNAFESRLLTGLVTYIDQFPWLATIEYEQKNQTKLLCGGALISRKYVLTAAHCVTERILKYGQPKNIRLGEFDMANEGKDCVDFNGSGLDCTDGTVKIPIESIIVHPEYNRRQRRNDIALIRMKQMATLMKFLNFISPICLPTSDVALSPPEFMKLQVAGWALNINSSSNVIQHADLQLQSLEKCKPAYNKSTDLWDGQICAGGQPSKETCKGDSGGPLMFQNDKLSEIIGITSFRPIPCDMKDVPGVYTKVHKYIDWIRNSIEPLGFVFMSHHFIIMY